MLWYLQGNLTTNTNGVESRSVMYQLPTLPVLPIIRPTAPLFSFDAGIADAMDFDIESSSRVWVGATSGLYLWQGSEAGSWSSTLFAAVTDIIFVGLSTDGSVLYVTTPTQLWSFDTTALQYTTTEVPLLTAPIGRQFRGVVSGPRSRLVDY